jgi:hypothetical protein
VCQVWVAALGFGRFPQCIIGLSDWLLFKTTSRIFSTTSPDDPFSQSTEDDSHEKDFIFEALQFQRDLVSFDEREVAMIKAPLSTPIFLARGKAD